MCVSLFIVLGTPLALRGDAVFLIKIFRRRVSKKTKINRSTREDWVFSASRRAPLMRPIEYWTPFGGSGGRGGGVISSVGSKSDGCKASIAYIYIT